MATRLAWLDRQFASLDTLVASLNNTASAIGGYANRPDKIALSVKGRVDLSPDSPTYFNIIIK